MEGMSTLIRLRLCQKRALHVFHLDEEKWGVNVQPLSGSPANFEVYTALLKPHERIMGLDLPHGGHLSHGFMTPKRRVSGTSIFFESMPYRLDETTGFVDYDMLEKTAILFGPKLIIAGASAYPRDFDYPRMREIADAVGAFLLMDMAHISGLVAASVVADPFEYCDVVTTTTHKGIDGARAEKILDMSSITLNKNSVPGDKNALVPGGIRIGTPAMTTRGLKEKDFKHVADLIHEGVQIAIKARDSVEGKKLKDFMEFVANSDFFLNDSVAELRRRVEALTSKFPIPGL